MRVFVTGASGWIGSATVPELIGAGHQVIGLARSDASADSLAAAGAEAYRGSLDDLDGLRSAAAASDGVIHLAFKHDIAFTGDFKGAGEADRRAIEAMGEALAGSDRPLLIASGTLGGLPGQVATERDGHGAMVAAHGEGPGIRQATAEYTISLASQGVRSSVVRLPPTNHGDGDNGFIAFLVGIARAIGELDLVQHGAQVGAIEHLKISLGELQFAEIGNVVRPVPRDEAGIVALDLARQHDQLRAGLR